MRKTSTKGANSADAAFPTPIAYNKWHETELERWLSDHDIPYPTPADRKDLENLIQSNWETYAVAPYKNWDAAKLNSYLQSKGVETKSAAEENRDAVASARDSRGIFWRELKRRWSGGFAG